MFHVTRWAWAAFCNWLLTEQDEGRIKITIDIGALATNETALEASQKTLRTILGQIKDAEGNTAVRSKRRQTVKEASLMKILQSGLRCAVGCRLTADIFVTVDRQLVTEESENLVKSMKIHENPLSE